MCKRLLAGAVLFVIALIGAVAFTVLLSRHHTLWNERYAIYDPATSHWSVRFADDIAEDVREEYWTNIRKLPEYKERRSVEY